MEDDGLEGFSSNLETTLQSELELLLQAQHNKQVNDREEELNIYRYGSAPPTVEGSVSTAVGGRLEEFSSRDGNIGTNSARTCEDEIQSHPAYLQYYYSHGNVNPRLPPPVLSKEDWRVVQGFQAGGSSFGGIHDLRKNVIAEDDNGSSFLSMQPVGPRLSTEKTENDLMKLRMANRQASPQRPERGVDCLYGLPSPGRDVGRKNFSDILQDGVNGAAPLLDQPLRSQSQNALDEIVASLTGLKFSENKHSSERRSMQQLIDESNAKSFAGSSNLARKTMHLPDLGAFEAHTMGRVNFPSRTVSSANLHSKKNSSSENLRSYDGHYYQGAKNPNMDFSSHLLAGMSGERKLVSDLNTYSAGSSLTGNDFNPELIDPAYGQYLQRNSDHAVNNLSHLRDQYLGGDSDLQKAYSEEYLARQQQYGRNLGNSAASNQRIQGNLKHGIPLQYPRNTRENLGIPSVGFRNAALHDGQVAHFPSMLRSQPEGNFTSLLDEFKNNKTRLFGLSDIYDHVVELSADPNGNHFIQQELETATEEERNKIFLEIMPHARSLMTNAFGNYVIQKLFDHGTASQRKELASELIGYVLPLSLQKYGTNVIQKALEVVDVEQKIQIVAEFDGSVMECVYDHYANHVIRKCIECVPHHLIQFIISSLYGKVATLSVHRYGCRIIQSVLEYCDDPRTKQIIMDEILQSVNNLAQDLYGNFVIQRVLEHGTSHERSAILSMLSGQIVRMSQHKYASNVVEKCLTFGSPVERKLLIQEIIGCTDDNECLESMIEDPFGNYVVQTLIKFCDKPSREHILSRIRVYLNTLNGYSRGNHIVSRLDKLFDARRSTL